MADHIDHLTSLHTALIDARNGYEEALKDAEGKGMTPLFREMMNLHQQHADALSAPLNALGAQVDDKGSFPSTVHRTVMSVRSLFGGLDESILPGLIDGEERIIQYYDEALQDVTQNAAEATLLSDQRQMLRRKIDDMNARKSLAA